MTTYQFSSVELCGILSRDNLSTKDKSPVPNVSVIQTFHYTSHIGCSFQRASHFTML